VAESQPDAPPPALAPCGPSRTVIVGAGPAGLSASIMLAQRGWKNIDVFDRLGALPKPDGDEWGNPYRSYNLGLSGRGQQVLTDLGVMDRVDCFSALAMGRMDWSPGKEEPNYREAKKAYGTPPALSQPRSLVRHGHHSEPLGCLLYRPRGGGLLDSPADLEKILYRV
jgi:2-polyprenyl-6-methoxyphenol hydroxylase-like FAD-dependent oxidoreductase